VNSDRVASLERSFESYLRVTEVAFRPLWILVSVLVGS